MHTMTTMSMALLAFLALLGVATGDYYAPLPTICPVSHQVSYTNVYLQAKDIDVVSTKVALPKLSLTTVYLTTVMPVTHFIYDTVTAAAQHIYVTDVQIVTTTIALSVANIETLTSTVCETVIDIVTQTATNDVTLTDIEDEYETKFVEAVMYQTVEADFTKTIVEVDYSTVVVVEDVEETEIVVETVAVTDVKTVTLFSSVYNTVTKTLTEVEKTTVCSTL